MGRVRIWLAAVVALLLAVVVGALVATGGSGTHATYGSMMGTSARGEGRAGEYQYLAQMVAHHREAIEAADQLSRSDRPAMRRLGADVVESQSRQVEQMTAWIRDWYPGRPTADGGYVPEMRDLTGLSGDALDEAFLADMVPHHMMAIMTSRHLLAAGTRHDEVARLARTIVVEQRAEVVTMLRWSRAWFGRALSGGTPGPMMGG